MDEYRERENWTPEISMNRTVIFFNTWEAGLCLGEAQREWSFTKKDNLGLRKDIFLGAWREENLTL